MMILKAMIAALLVFGSCAYAASASELHRPEGDFSDGRRQERHKPALVVLIVVDQFRSDYLTRFRNGFLPAESRNGMVGGLSWLMERGAYYPFAVHEVLQAMTGPGHATISTGSYPARNLIMLNNWWDRKAQKVTYCIQDDAERAAGIAERPGRGRSPRNLAGSTLGDQIKLTDARSRVVSISLKDRAAILLGGHAADAAIWFDESDFSWISSSYYCPDGRLPAWVERLNSAVTEIRNEKHVWKSRAGGCRWSDDGPVEFAVEGRLSEPLWRAANTGTGTPGGLGTPGGIDLTIQAAEAAISEYGLGRGAATDFLAVSLSPHDIIGHDFGPGSCRIEELTLHLDRALAGFFNRLSSSRPGGLDDVLFVLTSDHGVSHVSQRAASARLEPIVIDRAALTDRMEKALVARFGVPQSGSDGRRESRWILHVEDFNFYLNQESVAGAGIRPGVMENALRDLLIDEGVFLFAFTAAEAADRRLPAGNWDRRILNSYIPGHSGDVMAMPKPFSMDEECLAAHMLPYSYDVTVPMIFSGFGINPGVYANPAEPVSIAPTVAWLLDVIPPALSEGRVLWEIIDTTVKGGSAGDASVCVGKSCRSRAVIRGTDNQKRR